MTEENFPIEGCDEQLRNAGDLSPQPTAEMRLDTRGDRLCIPKDIYASSNNTPIHRSNPNFYRPVQYLGNKLRSIPEIIIEAEGLRGSNSVVYDLFSGTSVVSQAFAHLGCKVVAVDSQLSCQTMAAALLGIGREDEGLDLNLVQKIEERAKSYALEIPWKSAIQEEDAAINASDASWLHRIYAKKVPTIWKPTGDFGPLSLLASNRGGQAAGVAPLFALTLAGSYFGIRQALAIDSLRWAIGELVEQHQITSWQAATLLTALMTSMSEAVYSAGKHFAQPLTAGVAREGKFRKQRMLKDRGIDIYKEFSKAALIIGESARSGAEGHVALAKPAEDILHFGKHNPKLVYADPPYTAQQYSRFYHALETLVSYEIPNFDASLVITSGLYPQVRYKSAFSSKRNAPAAFRKLISGTASMGSDLFLSYSMSHSGSDGNDRMISLEQLLEICKHHYARASVEVIELNHAYRQFNSNSHSNVGRNDPEILIVCRS